jgi:hypothetical protein
LTPTRDVFQLKLKLFTAILLKGQNRSMKIITCILIFSLVTSTCLADAELTPSRTQTIKSDEQQVTPVDLDNLDNKPRGTYKSFFLAGCIGLVPGFGLGHLYAKGEWTKESTAWAIVDGAVLAAGAFGGAFAPSQTHHADPDAAFVFFLYAELIRAVWEGSSAAHAAVDHNRENNRTNYIEATPTSLVVHF